MKKNILAALILFLISIALFKDVIFAEKLPIPSDAIVALYYPYKDFYAKQFPRGFPFKNFLITDPLRQQYPWREIAIGSEKKATLPLWNPYNGAGEPLLANIQSAALYPLNILFFIFPFTLGWSMLIILQPLLAGVFIYLYLANLKVLQKASILGAISFAFCGFNMTWLEWGTIAHTGLWLPLILLSIDKLLKSNDLSLSNIKNKNVLIWSLIFIFSLGSSFLGGHLQTFFYVFVFCAIYFLSRWWQSSKSIKTLLFFMILVILFVIVTAVQWFPTLQLINNSARDIDQLWHKDGWFIPYAHLVQFLVPDFFGNPTTLNYWGTWNYGELTGYIGLLPFIMAFSAIITKPSRKKIFFVVLGLLAILLSTSNIVSRLPFQLSIPFISTAQPTRLLFIVDFCLSVLAAFGLDQVLKNKKEIIIPIVIISIIFVYLWALVLMRSFNPGVTPENLLTIKHNLILPSILLTGSALLIFAFFLSHKYNKLSNMFYVGIILLTIFDLIRFSQKFNTFTAKGLLYPQTKTIKFLKTKSADYPWRYLGIDYVENQKRIFPPNISTHDKLYTLDTYNPLLLKRYQQFAAVSEWGYVDIPDFSFNRAIILNNYESRLVDFMGVKYITAINDTYSKKLKYLFREGETRVYENLDVFPRAFMTYDVQKISDKKDIAKKMYDKKTNLRMTSIIEENITKFPVVNAPIKNDVKLIKYTENNIVLDVVTEKDGLLVLTDTYYPTWKVKIDDEEDKIYRTDYDFRGVVVRTGKHKVVFYNSLL